MKKLYILLFLGLSCVYGTAQNQISGRVTDPQNLPLAGASVFLPEINKGTMTDKDGHYEINNLPNGELRMRFSFLGYANVVQILQLSGRKVELNITLHPTVIEAEEIVVTGGYNSTQHENAVKIEVLKMSPSELKATPNFTEKLSRIPGVDMISKGGGVSKPVIRGLSMNDILVLNNGVRFENYQYSSHHPLGIDEFGIEDVEVVKGPASLLYGSDAIGGVLNFIKEKPAPIGSLVGDYNLQLFSNTLGVVQNLGIKGAAKKFSCGLRIGQKTNADFLQGGGEYVPNSRFNEHSVKTNLGYTAKGGTFKLYYDYNRQNLGLVEEEAIDMISERGRKVNLFFQQLNTHLLSSQNKLYLGRYRLDVNSALQNTELIHFGEIDTYEIQMKLATLTYETKLYLPSDEKTDYILGFQGMNQLNTNLNDRETMILPDATVNNYSAFGLFQREVIDKLKIQAGIRYDFKTLVSDAVGTPGSEGFRNALDKEYSSFSGSLGGTYHFSDAFLLRTNVAAAYRTPNLAELSSNGQHEARYELGNSDLVPENSFEFDVSTHYHKDNFSFDLAGFYNLINHYIFIAPTGETTASGIPVYHYRQNNSSLYGVEAGIHFHPKTIEWLHVLTTFSSVVGKQDDGVYLPFIPANKLNLEVRAEKEKFLLFKDAYFSVNCSNSADQDHAAPDETSTEGYSLFDLSVGGKVKTGSNAVIVGLSVTNIFDKKYVDHLSLLKEVNYFNPGRNIAFTLKIPFGTMLY